MKLRFLGTGTSTGVPQIMCNCMVCQSRDEHDKRLRSSVMVSYKDKNILIDCGPDFRQQMLECGSPALEALLITHSHYDHVGGVDDLRPYCALGDGFPIYCRSDVAGDLRDRVPYCFAEHPYPEFRHSISTKSRPSRLKSSTWKLCHCRSCTTGSPS